MQKYLTLTSITFIFYFHMANSQCSANWALPNIQQTNQKIFINTPTTTTTTTNIQVNQQYSISYQPKRFIVKPDIFMVINDYVCPQFETIWYSLSADVLLNKVLLKFSSKQMKWVSINIGYWLSSRNDLLFGYKISDQLITDNSLIVVGKFSKNLTSLSKTSQMMGFHSIVGIQTPQINIFEIQSTTNQIKDNQYNLSIVSSNKAKVNAVKIFFLVYILEESQFMSYSVVISQNIDPVAPVYVRANSVIFPVTYWLTGLQSLFVRASQRAFHFQFQLASDHILSLTSKLDKVVAKIFYLVISPKISDACNKCPGKIVNQDLCVNQCPKNTYIHNYDYSNKVCLSCFPKINQILTENGCVCSPGFTLNLFDICTPIPKPTSTLPILKSIQANEDELNPFDIIIYCKQNEILNNISTNCICDNYSIISQQKCTRCPIGTYKNVDKCVQCMNFCDICQNLSVCVNCKFGYTYQSVDKICVLVNGDILASTSDFSSDDFSSDPTQTLTQTPTPNPTPTPKLICQGDQSPKNGACECSFRGVYYMQICTQCPISTYKSGTTCLPCDFDEFCDECDIQNICKICLGNYYPIKGKCGTCSANQIYDNITTNCILTTTPTTPTHITCSPLKVLVNGVCQCNYRSVDDGDSSCIECPSQTYKNNSGCTICTDSLPNCDTCQTSVKCLTCMNGYYIDQSVAKGTCVCQLPNYIQGQFCIICPTGTIYNPTQNKCVLGKQQTNTITNPTTTNNPTTNPTTNLVNPTPTPSVPKCKQNQILSNNICVCNNKSILVQNICSVCDAKTFKNTQINDCSLCADILRACVSCSNGTVCQTCSQTFTLTGAGTCQCAPPLYLDNVGAPFSFDNAKCIPCKPGTIYNPVNQSCRSCLTNQQIVDGACKCKVNFYNISGICQSCLSNTLFSIFTNKCQPVTCKHNQQYTAGACVCNKLSINVSGVCQACLTGQWKNQNICSPCITKCQSCKNSKSCLQCVDQYQLNFTTQICQLKCKVNQKLLNGNCVCDDMSGKIQGICTVCPKNSVKAGETCINCSKNCMTCISSTHCTQCVEVFAVNTANFACCGANQIYNAISTKCQCLSGSFNVSGRCGTCAIGMTYIAASQTCETIKNCPKNQVLSFGSCECITNTVRNTLKVCQKCQNGTYYDATTSKCLSCLVNCVSCNNLFTCNVCQANYTGTTCKNCASGYSYTFQADNHCGKLQCGNGLVSSKEECDDGNTIGGDGCSSECLVQNGYICKQTNCIQLAIKLSESVTSAGVFMQFRFPSQQNLDNRNQIINIVSGPMPLNVRMSKTADGSILRAFLDFRGSLPPQNITVELSAESNLGLMKYINEYNLLNRVAIERKTIIPSLKQVDFYL